MDTVEHRSRQDISFTIFPFLHICFVNYMFKLKGLAAIPTPTTSHFAQADNVWFKLNNKNG